jgi:hypothetical protein
LDQIRNLHDEFPASALMGKKSCLEMENVNTLTAFAITKKPGSADSMSENFDDLMGSRPSKCGRGGRWTGGPLQATLEGI